MTIWRKILIVLVALVAAAVVLVASHRYFLSEERTIAEGRLSFYRSSVVAEIERFSHLTHVLALDPFVIDTAEGAPPAPLDARLRDFAAEAGLDAIYLMTTSGLTIAASNAGMPASFVGQDYGFRPYFQDALTGEQGRFYGIGATTGLPGYFIADPVRGEAGTIIGVVAIKLDLSRLARSWQNAGERVILADRNGVVLLASDPDWRYRTLEPLDPAQRAAIEQARQFPGQPLDMLDWAALRDGRAQVGGQSGLHLVADDLAHGWALHYFADADRAVARSWLLTASFVMLAGIGFIAFQFQRTRRMGAALRRSAEEEAQLRIANDLLAREIEERRTAERRLSRTQGELERASRLAALGQLAASVTHELGQPIAAMRNHLAAAEMQQGGGGKLVGRLTALVERMEGITRQLKFFARSGNEDLGPVDLISAMQAALELVAPNLGHGDVSLVTDWAEDPVKVTGNRLRLEQVMTNLLRNAIEAVEDADHPTIHVRIGKDADGAWFEVADNGHGLGGKSLDDLKEPFITTRESGQGMGLGLTISAGIVEDHGALMSACAGEESGAIFRVTFPAAEAVGDEAA